MTTDNSNYWVVLRWDERQCDIIVEAVCLTATDADAVRRAKAEYVAERTGSFVVVDSDGDVWTVSSEFADESSDCWSDDENHRIWTIQAVKRTV